MKSKIFKVALGLLLSNILISSPAYSKTLKKNDNSEFKSEINCKIEDTFISIQIKFNDNSNHIMSESDSASVVTIKGPHFIQVTNEKIHISHLQGRAGPISDYSILFANSDSIDIEYRLIENLNSVSFDGYYFQNGLQKSLTCK